MNDKKIAVLGAGNGGQAAAADLSLRGFNVNLFEMPTFQSSVQNVFETHEITLHGAAGEGTATLSKVTTSMSEAIEDAAVIFLVVPAIAHKSYATELAKHVKNGQLIVLLPGTFGSLVVWNELKKVGKTNCIVAETHTLPYATRLIESGESMVMSLFDPLQLGVIPAKHTKETVNIIKEYYPQVVACETVLACGLSSNNPIIHVPGVIMNAGRIEYAKGEFWFYQEGVTPCVARTIEAIDKERIALLQAFDYHYEPVSKSLGGEIETDNIYEAIKNNSSFAKIKGPTDTKNRYYSEDIPYGMTPWALLGKQVNIPTPLMDAMVNIGNVVLQKNCWQEGRTLEDLGIKNKTIKEIQKFLLEG